LRPAAIIEYLDLLKPGYVSTAAYGHFGRKGPPWEKTHRAEELRAALGSKTKAKSASKTNGAAEKKAPKKVAKKKTAKKSSSKKSSAQA
ncbi:MAG: methionine adenosyltransferase domain-containing protein, partial [Myxococcales bacterium]|nr:methionine adenosyltransferase domain-containing protein [Myxococcales bacterium]